MCVVMEHCARILSSNCSDAMGEREEGRKRRKEERGKEGNKRRKEKQSVGRTLQGWKFGKVRHRSS